MKRGFLCQSCGVYHEDLPLHYGTKAPAYYLAIPEEQREDRCLLSSDLCMVDDEQFFICGNLEIPIRQTNQFFSWDVWVSLSKTNFQRVIDMWEVPGRECEPPYFGWLSTCLPFYPNTLSMKTLVHTRPIGQRPAIELEAIDHPLATEQKDGITWERIQEIAEKVLHQD